MILLEEMKMSNLLIVINEDEDIYRTINLTGLLDNELSWKAKGIHYYFRTRPKSWNINFSDLLNKSTDGHDSNRSGIKELIDKNYLYRTPIRDEKQQIKQWIYISFPKPLNLKDEELKKLLNENLVKGNHNKGNPSYSYNNIGKESKDSSIRDKEMEINFHKIGTSVPNDRNIDEKDKSYSPHKTKVIPIPKENKYITLWNSFKISMHKREHKKQGSQTYIRASSILKEIEKGSFHNKRKLDPEFMEKHFITKEIISSPLSEKQMKDTIDKLKLLFIDGYWGYGKYKTKNLPSLLYNNASMTSMFYAVMCNDNLTRPNTEKFSVHDDNEDITNLFIPLFSNGNGKKLSHRDHMTLVYGVQELVRLHEQFKERVREGKWEIDPSGKFFQMFRHPYDFLGKYCEFMEAWKDDVNIYPNMVKPNSWMWDKFLDDYLYEDLSINLRID
jgi:hypothetical protein